jgi:hypothetical protein
MSDEAYFDMLGYVNTQNCWFWAANNLHELRQCLMHGEKATVWCAISSGGFTGPYFFEDGEGQTVTVKLIIHGHAGNISVKQVKFPSA